MSGLRRVMVGTLSDADLPSSAGLRAAGPGLGGGTLPRTLSAVTSLQDIREVRNNLPRQLKYSFWQR